MCRRQHRTGYIKLSGEQTVSCGRRMRHRVKNKVCLSVVGIIIFVQLSCTSNPPASSNSNAAAKSGSETAQDNANPPGNANASEQKPATSPAEGGTPSASDASSPAAPPSGVNVPAAAGPATAPGQAGVPPAGTPEPPPPPPPRTFTLASGRSIPVFTTSTLTTKSSKSGEQFTCTLATPIVDDDW